MPLQLHVGAPASAPIDEQAKFYARAEELGFAGVGAADDARYADPFDVLSAAVDVTRSIWLYPAVTNPATRTAVQQVRLIQGLAERAPGRIKIALGTGDAAIIDIAHDRPVKAKHPAHLATLKKRVLDVREMLGEGSVALFDHLPRGLPTELLPPPVMMAASGERTLEAAGEVADEVFVTSGLTSEARRAVTSAIALGASRSQRRAREVPVMYHAMVSMDDDRDAAIERTRWWLHFLLGRGVFRLSLKAMRLPAPPFPTQESIPADFMERLASGFALAGTPKEVRARVERLESDGVRTVFCMLPGGPKQNRQALERIARHLLPVVG